MKNLNILITGGSGCVGRYLVHELDSLQGAHLFLLTRKASTFNLNPPVLSSASATIIEGDLKHPDSYRKQLKEMDFVVHAAASWGGKAVFDINVDGTLNLFRLTHSDRCRKILYFSTASLLDENNRLDSAAKEKGTPYLKSKFDCLVRLREMTVSKKIQTLYPTVVIGGDGDFPQSHAVRELLKSMRYLRWLKFLSIEGSFHFIHARDIARIVVSLLAAPEDTAPYVLGNAPITLDECLSVICQLKGMRRGKGMDVTRLLQKIAPILRGKHMDAWEKHALQKKHFLHEVVATADFGIPSRHATLKDALRGIL